MGGGASFKPFAPTFVFFLVTLTLISAEAVDARETPLPTPNLDDGGNAIGKPPSPPPPLPPPGKPSAFKPGVAVVVAILTTVFSLTFLLLLYIKHCSGGGGVDGGGGNSSSRVAQPFAGRKNSGIDRTVVESLPIFRFGSLMGQKDGLDCAVCLTKFEASEVLRLLPKCKHAFHVECVDTWLDAHSTCPLCRYRVDPEDILLVEDAKILRQNQPIPPPPPPPPQQEENLDVERGIAEIRRVSGRHSSVGEREGGLLQIILQTGAANGNESDREAQNVTTSSFRRSLDSATASASSRKKSESVGNRIGVGCFARPRKDGFLLNQDTEGDRDRDRERDRDRTSVERRLEHRIIVSPSPKSYTSSSSGGTGLHLQLNHQQQRWSDVQPSDLLYLTSEMIISETRGSGFSSSSFSRPRWQQHGGGRRRSATERKQGGSSSSRSTSCNDGDEWNSGGGRGVINSRSVSEITGLSRFLSNNNNNNNDNSNNAGVDLEGQHQQHQRWQREEGVVTRWLAWISKSQTQTAVR